ncbi:nifU-like protein 1, chloroplastic [Zingiber officinale]|uniref:nifU-like protein 1, chloroplastic n=1 Tax=Zingiber officinale TaxID=94328 RepID=UPI001C4C7EF7|nr:nifU-like protein 1, chloroplastic [Zingiber officinale]
MESMAAAAALSKAPNLSCSFRHHAVEPSLICSPHHRSLDVRRGRRRTAGRWASSNTPSTPSAAEAQAPGLYSAKVYELTKENVDLVLNDVRPYLISDGGNVDVVSVDDGVISLQLQGACGSCPSSTTTMKMGIERVLKEKFGEAVKDIQQVEEANIETTVEAVNNHLEILRPAIRNYGGSIEVVSVEGGDCSVRYSGPDSIGSGIKAAIKEKFTDIINVVFVN